MLKRALAYIAMDPQQHAITRKPLYLHGTDFAIIATTVVESAELERLYELERLAVAYVRADERLSSLPVGSPDWPKAEECEELAFADLRDAVRNRPVTKDSAS